MNYYLVMQNETRALQSIVETVTFAARARKLMDAEEIAELVNAIAANPTMGDIIPGTGGARKLRWARPGRGKSAGFRVITYYCNNNVPVFLLDIYGKNEKSTLSEAEKNVIAKMLERFVDIYRGA